MARTLAVVVLLIVCTIVHTNCSSSQWIIVRCPEDGTSIKTPRKASTSYRIYGSRYEAGYRSSLAALRTVAVKRVVSDSLRDSVAEFRTYLAKERQAIENQLRKTITNIQKDPCDSSARKDFQLLLENINFNAQQLRRITIACRDTSADLKTMLKEYRRDSE